MVSLKCVRNVLLWFLITSKILAGQKSVHMINGIFGNSYIAVSSNLMELGL